MKPELPTSPEPPATPDATVSPDLDPPPDADLDADPDVRDTAGQNSQPGAALNAAPVDPSSSPLAPGLYLVATPIGNLEDISVRALRVLRLADLIACEDTRQTSKLLSHYGLSKPTVSYHQHNEQARTVDLLSRLAHHERIAVVSDAGTPGIADPGGALVEAAIQAGIPVIPIPGANAALSALIASGLSAERFTFHGFLPAREGARRSTLERLLAGEQTAPFAGESGLPVTHIFYETPHRILATLGDFIAVFGPGQPLVLARELTKLHEEFLRGTGADLLATLESRAVVRGEFVLLFCISAPQSGTGSTSAAAPPTLASEVRAALRSGLSEKDALKQVAKARGLGKSEAYREWQRHKR